jgi:hypothetical protein
MVYLNVVVIDGICVGNINPPRTIKGIVSIGASMTKKLPLLNIIFLL